MKKEKLLQETLLAMGTSPMVAASKKIKRLLSSQN